MRKNKFYIISFLLLNVLASAAQKAPIGRTRFFKEDGLIEMDLSTDLKKLVSEKKLETYQPGMVTLRLPDSTVITEPVTLTARGEFRRTNCFLPTLRLNFQSAASPLLSPLKKLKLVCGCGTGAQFERLVLKEYLVYKIYNLLTDKSFRVRLLHINYEDTRKKIKAFTQYGFLIEDVDEMAKRNKCNEVEKKTFHTENTDRQQMTLVALFQYMIGNTDWAVPNYHNIKLMKPVTDTIAFPYTIPYDFDFCGLVNATYATPQEELGTNSVKERVYRGFARNMGELQNTLNLFREKREEIEKLVKGFEYLSPRYRNEIIDYIDEFYREIENKSFIQEVFISNARTN